MFRLPRLGTFPRLGVDALFGGAGVGFSPADVVGYIRDYDAHILASLFQDSGKTTPVTSDGDPVGAWVEQVVGDDVLQTVTAAKATYRAAVAALNNQPALEFDGGDLLSIATWGSGALSQPLTTFTVVQETDVSTTRFIHDGNVNVFRLFSRAVAPVEYRLQAPSIVGGGTPDTNVHIFTAVWNGASSEMWLDGTSLASGDVGANTLDGFVIGGNSGETPSLVGFVARILIYSGDLSLADKNLIQTFLATRYGITVVPIT